MMRSMYAGVSGLRNHQQRMDVIGNNIANVNTYGYKKARVVFKDALNQTIRGGSAPTTDRGGTNPQSIGLGVALSSIDTICTAGSTQTTGNNTDLAIDGNGYFVVSGGGETAYTRAGNFSFDSAGNYVNSGNGMKVMGWMADISNDWTIDTTMALQAIDISGYKTVNPVSTTSMELEGNCDSSLSVLSATDHTTKLTSKDVYDSLGNTTTLYFQFEKMWSGNQIVPADASTTWSTSGTAGNRPGTIWRIRASSEPNCPAPTGTAATTTTDYFMAFDENGNLYDSAVWPGTTTAEPDDLTITWDSNVMALFNDTANAELTSQNIT
ncbi:MAG: flagellar hook-basal body complex protein, partial [Ignavibacteriales bacterium]